MTVLVADLFIGMSVTDTYRIPNPSSHRAMTLKQVYLPPPAILEPLSNLFLFSTMRNDQEAFRRDPSDHISLLSRFLSTKLAKACAYMSQVATYCIRISMVSSPPPIFYARNACTGDPTSLARPAYRRRVRGISSVQPAGSRGRR